MINKTLLTLLPLGLLSGCNPPPQSNENGRNEITVTLSNPAGGSDIAQLLDIPLPAGTANGQYFRSAENLMAAAIDSNGDKQADRLRILATVAPGEQQSFSLEAVSALPDLAHVELSVRQNGGWQDRVYQADGFDFETVDSFTSPPQLTDHSYYLRYEGPGWENDRMGYRLYLDWRNAIDVFGKTTHKMVLPEVGQDGYDSYHQMADWGMDLLKVGKALGLGALGRLTDSGVAHMQQVEQTRYQLLENTSLNAVFNVSYNGWQVDNQMVDVSTDYHIHGKDGATRIQVKTSEPVASLVTGLVRHGLPLLQQQGDKWGYIATFGNQSLAGDTDNLGMAIFYRLDQVEKQMDSEFDHLLLFKPATQTIEYQILAEWPQHPEGVQDQQGFEQLLQNKLAALDYPLTHATP
ncbi:DUF4861 family protein [Lacimicrobium alkaliphilum]|uniref:DUF4861 domain-containing protein n=1 Tax=Lacimicrobium alkaliphilum TaxID=1526571 RepID=A0A0U2QJN5_9ALTE|nr:DUF4861 family protein [Lacimicrobium alkaliphilum]ALS97307.1 hypothetical protein AT746_02820 [Lacimicrobium alkaliphilum]